MPPAAKRPEKTNTREAILDAAESVVARDGAKRLTIDAVVTESGFSKGGVLYHFPNKSELLKGMVARMVESYATEVEAAEKTAAERNDPEHLHVVYALCARKEHKDTMSQALLAAIAEQPELLDPARTLVRELTARFSANSSDPVLAYIILLAIDGLHHRDLLQLDPPDDKQRDAVQARLADMIRNIAS